jgi:hypothetical protein
MDMCKEVPKNSGHRLAPPSPPSFIATLPDGYQVSWADFHEAFQGHHIPDGLLDRKQQEFLDLK